MSAAPTSVVVNKKRFDTTGLRVLEMHADYACGRSGKCCDGKWNVELFPSDAERLKEGFLGCGMAEDEIDSLYEPHKNGSSAGMFRMTRNANGCSCLSGEPGATSCKIIEKLDTKRLPSVCQTFPRLTTRTPAGLYLNLSYCCPTAAKLLLKENALHETAPRSVYQDGMEFGGAVYEKSARPPRLGANDIPEWSAFDYFWRWAAEWTARPGLTPTEALFWVGQIVTRLEATAPASGRLAELMPLLDQFMDNDPAKLAAECAGLDVDPLLGPIYLNSIQKLADKSKCLDGNLGVFILRHSDGGENPDYAAMAEEFDKRLRPNLGDFEVIERNFIASRLFPTNTQYGLSSMRMAYFSVVLSLISLRYHAVAIAKIADEAVQVDHYLKAAGMTDRMFQHDLGFLKKMDEALEPTLSKMVPMDLTLPSLA